MPGHGRAASPEWSLAQVQSQCSPLGEDVQAIVNGLMIVRLPGMRRLVLPRHSWQLARQHLCGLRASDQPWPSMTA
ncbi:hypothetical protein D3C79_849850 [compost metagenome]